MKKPSNLPNYIFFLRRQEQLQILQVSSLHFIYLLRPFNTPERCQFEGCWAYNSSGFFPFFIFYWNGQSYCGTGSCVISFPAVPWKLKKGRDSIKFLPQVGSVAESLKLGWDQGEKKTRNTNVRDSKVQGGRLWVDGDEAQHCQGRQGWASEEGADPAAASCNNDMADLLPFQMLICCLSFPPPE